MVKTGLATILDFRSIWPRETDLTNAIATSEHHKKSLEEVIGFKMGLLTEQVCCEIAGKQVGRMDLIANIVGENTKVVFEFQYENADDKHRGQIQKYLTPKEISTAVWVAESFSPAEIAIMTAQCSDFSRTKKVILLEMRCIRVDNSAPALIFHLAWHSQNFNKAKREVAATVEEIEEQQKKKATKHEEKYAEYWQEFDEYLKEKSPLGVHFYSPYKHSRHAALGMDKVRLAVLLGMKRISVGPELKGKHQEKLFQFLLERKETIEAEVGDPLIWDPKIGKNQMNIRLEYRGNFLDANEREHQFDWIYRKSKKLHAIFWLHVQEFRKTLSYGLRERDGVKKLRAPKSSSKLNGDESRS